MNKTQQADPNLERVYVERIRDALRTKNWKEMERWAGQWIAHAPQDERGFLWLARATRAQHNLSRASYSYGRILDINSKHPEALEFFASQKLQRTGFQSKPVQQRVATNTIDSSTSSSTTSSVGPRERAKLAASELHLAESYEECKLYANASQAFLRSLEWKHNLEAVMGAARCLHREFKSHEAIQLLKRELTRKSDWIAGRNLLAKLYFELGKKLDAQREWQLVLRFNPQNNEALNHLRRIFIS